MKYIYKEAKQVVCCGDIHGAFESLVYKACIRYKMTDTVIIVAGDCGFGFEKQGYYETVYNRVAGRLRKANNWVVFVRGNHDDPAYFNDERIRYKRFRCVPDYSIIEAAGHHILCVGGAVSIDRRIRIDANNRRQTKETSCYWADELPVFSNDLVDSIDCKIDTVVTHSAPSFCYPSSKLGVLSWALRDENLFKDIDYERKVMNQLFTYLKENRHPLCRWVYGHYHETHKESINGITFNLLDCEELMII